MHLSIIAAMSENRTIGKDNRLPWKLPDEWAYFKRVTKGKPFLMGRNSFESEDGLFSDYRNVVLSSQPDLELPEHMEQAHDMDEAFRLLSNEEEVFVVGGVSLYEELLPRTDKLYLSIVHATVEGDSFFPAIHWPDWQQIYSDRHEADAEHAYAFSMNQYIRHGIKK